ncbi:McrC family protein [Methanocaldococcus infernus]
MNEITFYEHQAISFKELQEKLNLDKEEIVKLFKKVNLGNNFNENNGIFTIYYDRIKANQYVGFICLDNLVIQVLPKVFKNYKKNQGIKAFLLMINLAFNLNIKKNELKALSSPKSSLYEIFIYLFAKSLLNEIKRGFYKEYVKFKGEEKFLKGKLLISKQIKKLPHQRHKFSIEFHKLTSDNLLNQIFHYTTYISLKNTNLKENKKLLSNLVISFNDVTLRKISLSDFKGVKFTRLNKRFRTAFNLAKIVLQSLGEFKKERIYGFFEDMNTLFEKFILSILSEEFKIKYQEKFKLFSSTENIKNLEQKPDYIMYKGNKPILILDAKYQEIEKENEIILSPDILRQIYTYARYYSNVNKDIVSALIFPKSKSYNNFDKRIIGKGTFFDGLKLYILTYDLDTLIKGDVDKEFISVINEIYKF